MSENQLIVIEEESNVFKKALKNISKTFKLSSGNFRGFVIGFKREKMINLFMSQKNSHLIADVNRREYINAKYDRAYAEYLSALDSIVVNGVYQRVRTAAASYEEVKLIEQYQKIMQLKDTDHMEFKYKRQRFLIEKDFETVAKYKHPLFIADYKEFFVYKMDNLYKTILRTYSVKLMEKEGTQIYDEMFQELENYITDILPYKIEISEMDAYKEIYEQHKKLEEYKMVEKHDTIKYIEKNMLLLAISRDLFTHSLPLVAAEQCYIKLLKEARNLITIAKDDMNKGFAYNLIIKLIDSYNVKLLSKKTYWDNPKAREEYKVFWREYQRISKLENIDYDEHIRQKESLFIYYDLKMLNRSSGNKFDIIKDFYRRKLKMLKGLRAIKNRVRHIEGKYTMQKDRV